MKKIILIICMLLCVVSNAHALNLSRAKTWNASDILTAADLNAEFNNILNHSLTNNDIDAAAGIVGSKLDLSAAGIIGGTTPAAGTFTTLTATSLIAAGDFDIGGYDFRANTILADDLTSGRVVFASTNGQLVDDLDLTFSTDTLTVTKIAAYTLTGKLTAGAIEIEGSNFDINGCDVSAGTISGSLTWSAAQDFNNQNLTNIDIDSGAIDGVTLGGAAQVTISDADINDGTMDGVQIGGTTATGELIVNDASDNADGLGSQGTSGQFLQSAGAGANPIFADPTFKLIETKTFSNDTHTYTFSGLSADVSYLLVYDLAPQGGTGVVSIRFSGDTGNNYTYYYNETEFDNTAIQATAAATSSGIVCKAVANVGILGRMHFMGDPGDGSNVAWAEGTFLAYDNAASNYALGQHGIFYNGSAGLSSITVYESSGSRNWTGTASIYQITK
jgi:hypothetical protein